MADNEQEELSATVDQLWRSVVNGDLSDHAITSAIILFLRHPQIYSTPNAKCPLWLRQGQLPSEFNSEYSCKLALGTCGQIYVVTLGAI
jgi:hypothetical protein